MHHFIFPTQDAYISNKSSEINKNFGLDEMLVVGVSQSYAKVVNPTKTYSYSNEYVAGMGVKDFTGKFTGSALLYSSTSTGSIIGGYNNFVSSYFSGSLTGSVSGYETGSSFTSFNFSGSLQGFNGTIVANTIDGWVSGSLTTSCFSTFTGILSGASGSLTGYLTGNDTRDEQNTTIVSRRFIKRSLLKFDLSFISQSIVSGDITNPKFYLKMYVTEARELPVEYSIFTFPVSQAWVQGDGYWSDDGSDEGVSWNWKNKYSGSAWFAPQRSDIITSSIDYLGNYGYVSESFLRGGGTWYNVPCSQSFSYESSDLNIDVTSIVNSWLNQSIANNGLIIMCSEETNPSGSNAHLFFFSRETNTIYSPHLDIAWDDQIFVTGSIGTGSVTIYPQTGSLNNSFLSGFLSNSTVDSLISCSMVSNYPQTVTDEISGSLTGSVNFIYQGLSLRESTGSLTGSVNFASTTVETPIITQFTQSVSLINTLPNTDISFYTFGGTYWNYSFGYQFSIGNDKYSLVSSSFRLRENVSGSIISLNLYKTASITTYVPEIGISNYPLDVTFSYDPSTVTGIFSDVHFTPTTEVVLEPSCSYLLLISVPSSSAEYEVMIQSSTNNHNSYFTTGSVITHHTSIQRYNNGFTYLWGTFGSNENMSVRLGVDKVYYTASVVSVSETSSYFATGSNGTTYTGSISGSVISGNLYGIVILGDLSGSIITGSSDGNQFSGSYGGTFESYLTNLVSETGSYFATGSNGTTYTGSISGSIISGSLYGIVILGDLSGSIVTGSGENNQFSGSYGGTFVSYTIPNFSGSFSGSGLSGGLISEYVYGDIIGTIVSGSLSGSIYTGNLSGSLITGSSDGTYFVGGLYDSEYFLSGSIIFGGMSGSVLANAFITSSLYSGYVSGYVTGQVVSGIFTSGDLAGTNFVGTIVGSYSTSSYSVVTVITESVFHPINSEKPFTITIQNLKKEYNFGDNPRINIFAREKIPLKTFEKAPQQSVYVNTKLLPSSSFYAIKDNETEEFIIDFDNYTKISCDLDGHYFDLNTSALEKERYYKVVIKVDCLDGNIYTFDNHAVFQVRR